MKFKSILIVTYARSGSTLLQGVLNSIDGVLIRGENKNFIQGLYDAYQRLSFAYHSRRQSEYFQENQFLPIEHSWYGADKIELPVFLNYCENMIRDILLGEYQQDQNIVCYGFKEIRYYELATSGIRLQEYLDFLQQVFPNLAIIFNTRNLNGVLKSNIWCNRDKLTSMAQLMKLEHNFSTYTQKYPENTFALTYEDMITKSDNFKSLFDFLGCGYSSQKIDDVLSRPHSYSSSSIKILDGKVMSNE